MLKFKLAALLCFVFHSTEASSSTIDSLITEFQTVKSDSIKMRLARKIGYQFEPISLDSSLKYLDLGLAIANQNQNWERAGMFEVNKAFAYFAYSRKEPCINSLKKALAFYRKSNDQHKELLALYNLGHFSHNLDEFVNSVGYYQDALALSKELKEQQYYPKILNNLSLAYQYLGNSELAIEYLLETIAFREKTGDKDLVLSYANLGVFYNNLGDHQNAIRYYDYGLNNLDKFDGKGNDHLDVFINKTLALIAIDSIEQARSTLEQVNRLSIANTSALGRTKYYHTKGHLYYQTGKLKEATIAFENAIQEFPEQGDERYKSIVFRAISEVQFNHWKKTGNNKFLVNADGNATKALDLAQQVQLLEKQHDITKLLLEINKSLKNLPKVNQYANAYIELSDSLNQVEQNKKVMELQVRYESDKKDLEINLLHQENKVKGAELNESIANEGRERNLKILFAIALIGSLIILFLAFRLYAQKRKGMTELINKNEIISVQNEERELLLKEIHHRVKNNLQVVSSLLDSQKNALSDESARMVVEDGQSRVKAMALIHEKLYQNEDLGKVDFQTYANQLFVQLRSVYHNNKQVDFQLEGEQAALEIDTAVPVGLILNEIISNALKYAEPIEGNLKISIDLEEEKEGHYKLMVKDNGQGLPENFDFEKSRTLGLRLVRRLARQLYGKAEYQMKQGAAFTVEFKTDKLRRETA